MRKVIFALPLLAAACSSPGSTVQPLPISANPVQTAVNAVATTQIGQTVEQGLLNAEYNLDQAIAIGVLQPNDQPDACLHQALTIAGLEPTPAGGTPAAPIPQFTPKVTDLISGGSVLYILSQQAKSVIGGGIQVPVSCQAVVGQFVLQAIVPGVNAIPTGPISAAKKKS